MTEIPKGPITAKVVKRRDHTNPAQTFFVCRTKEGQEIIAYRPDHGDCSHLPLIAVGDAVKVKVEGPADKRPDNWKGKVLPREEQLNAVQTEWRRREQGQHGKFVHVEAELSEADHSCLKYAHKLEKRVRPSLTLAEYTRELLLGSLHPVRALWLSQQQEGKANG